MKQATTFWLVFMLMFALSLHAQAEEEKPADAGPKVIYHPMDEPMIINLVSPKHPRYVQLGMTFLVDSEETVNAIELHMPVIRNDVGEIISQMSVKSMQEPGVRKLVRAQVLNRVNEILDERAGLRKAVQDIYFDKFVVQ